MPALVCKVHDYDVVSPRDLVQGSESASATHCVSNIASRVFFLALVRRPCRFASILPRRNGVGPTKKQTQVADILHYRQVNDARNRYPGEGAVCMCMSRGELCARNV